MELALLQVIMKVGAAMAAGCTMVLKPSEVAPISTMIFAEVMDAAGVPKGVFNLVNGDGPTVGRQSAAIQPSTWSASQVRPVRAVVFSMLLQTISSASAWNWAEITEYYFRGCAGP